MESVTPQLSMNFTTSDINTPGSIIQLEELISMNVSITLPEVRLFNYIKYNQYNLSVFQGLISSLMVQINQTEMLPVGHFVRIVQGEVVHIGQYISNLLLSVGDTASSENITITQNSVRFSSDA